jgi:AcrR family transcriptional regulator
VAPIIASQRSLRYKTSGYDRAVSEQTLDRRQRKTRAALHRALLELVATTPFDQVTVESVTNAADLARPTFYAHYHDKYELLGAAAIELMDGLVLAVSETSLPQLPTYSGTRVLTILQHAQEHRSLYRLLINGEGGLAAREKLIDTFTAAAQRIFIDGSNRTSDEPQHDLNVSTTAFVGALLMVIERWIDGRIKQDAETLAATFMRQQIGGLEWVLGYRPGEATYVPLPDAAEYRPRTRSE